MHIRMSCQKHQCLIRMGAPYCVVHDCILRLGIAYVHKHQHKVDVFCGLHGLLEVRLPHRLVDKYYVCGGNGLRLV